MAGFSSRLKEIRKDKHLRQKDLADALGLAQTTIANYEQGTRFPDEPTLSRVADFFGVSLDFLMGRSVRRSAKTGGEELPREPVRLGTSAGKYLESLIQGNQDAARIVVLDSLRKNVPIQEIYRTIFEAALHEVGRLWATGRIDVFQEHFISTMTETFMAMLSERFPSPSLHRTAIGIASGGEMHQIGARMVLDFLGLAGWHTRFLGTNLPTPSLMNALADSPIDLVAISVTMDYNRNQAADLIQAIRETPAVRHTRILIGGRALNQEPDLWIRLKADGYARDATEAVKIASTLFAH
ncbi:MAG TPA: cobalamin-dependent protein [Spirochaetia bacterium]|nr:cobalamin-dependent protein [Spirochaetia bacterium]